MHLIVTTLAAQLMTSSVNPLWTVSGRYLYSQNLDSEIPRRYLDSKNLDSQNRVRARVRVRVFVRVRVSVRFRLVFGLGLRRVYTTRMFLLGLGLVLGLG